MLRDYLTRAGLVLGLGFGGFFDGIVFHQICGWHHMVCTTATCQPTSIEHLKRQNTQDGFFHLGVWLLTIVGVVLLFRAASAPNVKWSGVALFGAMLAGWGTFNFVEGLVDHQIIGIHHLLPGHSNQLLFDLLFLASGLLLTAAGWAITRWAHFRQRL